MGLIKKLEDYFFSEYPLRRLLKNTQQDKIYHQEGDVWIHTKLVLESLVDDKEFQDLNKYDQRILLVSALLHDIAKPFSSREEDGRIKTPNHGRNGELEARMLLYKFDFIEDLFGNIDFNAREEICSLVRYHGLPLFVEDRNRYERRIMGVSFETKLKHLAILTRADANGRICPDKKEFVGRINSFIEKAKELGCYENERRFVDEKSKMFYFIYGDNYLYYSPYEVKHSNVILLSGLPGAGKTTYIMENHSYDKIISLEGLRKRLKISPKDNQGQVIQTGKEIAKRLLAKKEDFVWDGTNTSRATRRTLIKLFADYNANVDVVYLETDYKNLLERNNKRDTPVPEVVIEKFIKNLQPPKRWESMNIKNIIT